MPRPKSTRRGGAALGSRQSSLSFGNRKITKPSVTKVGKDKTSVDTKVKAAKLLEEQDEAIKVESPSADTSIEDIKDVTPEEDEEKAPSQGDLAIRTSPRKTAAENNAVEVIVDEAEARAKKISDAQIKRYWKGKEDGMKTKRVHQQELSLHEKILREFDISNQYGPCVGITRTRRWKRADKLGLKPPVEVLAVLLKADASSNNQKMQRAYVDELVNARLGLVAE